MKKLLFPLILTVLLSSCSEQINPGAINTTQINDFEQPTDQLITEKVAKILRDTGGAESQNPIKEITYGNPMEANVNSSFWPEGTIIFPIMIKYEVQGGEEQEEKFYFYQDEFNKWSYKRENDIL